MEHNGTKEQLFFGVSRVENARINIEKIIATMNILIDAIEDELPEEGDSAELAAHFAYRFKGTFRDVYELALSNLVDSNAEITKATDHLYHCLKSE